ncbi:DNA mismatch repair protein MutL [Weissella uvarum]|uniref:DNA mismatch repair endonuclease MutL n=1 Tax=Weissella uvarum TaxID=1479233 RepID=UPI00196017E0|nr:DNA mismatch repair endonuclease MutL [Weissella uvarum]MBM7616485.1 DNA mismatch repair protein MutL [Weissella uvarum]MCM0595054.1 DNA mismatch repair endonuclease MutL [Weissella uvarum]
MAKIETLSENLANQIAAGEVIERPASVVKELAENAIDAQAQHIDVLIEEAGIKSIRVIDDGQGIPADEVIKAFERHATSKINSRHDLFRIHSLGFRGEALPSIASVSDVTLTTAPANQAEGRSVHIKGGELISEQAATARLGTDITVNDLFYNTPARLKYLKAPTTELSKIVDVMNRLALSHPDISFRLVHNQKEILKTAGNGQLQQVVSDVYGIQQARKMLSFEAHDNDFSLRGLTSLPELTRANRSYISIIINGRYIKNYQLSNAVVRGYGSKLMVGRFPISVLEIEMDPLLIDVNVHPQKHEVRLSKENELVDLIERTIYERIAQENLIPNAYQNYLGTDESDEQSVDFVNKLNEASAEYTADTPKTPAEATNSVAIETIADTRPQADATGDTATPDTTPIVVTQTQDLEHEDVQAFAQRYQEHVDAFGTETPDEAKAPYPAQQAELNFDQGNQHQADNQFPHLSYIGQMHGTFLFAQSDSGLYMVDQHAAQERIKYEYYRDEIAKEGLESQRLLVPIVLEYSTEDALTISGKLSELEALGLHLEPFGDNTFIMHDHPAWFPKGQEEATVREMIDWFLRDDHLTLAQFREKTAIMMACKRSIKAHWKLNDFEAQGLLDQLRETKNPYNCPHGRPVLVTFTLNDMEKMFKRIQDSHEAWVEYDEHPF